MAAPRSATCSTTPPSTPTWRASRRSSRGSLDFSAGPTAASLVDNRDWTAPVTLLDFLRDVGKHVTVNAMLAKESVRARLESEDGISFTEFSYMLLQANDYCWLHEHHGCELQVGRLGPVGQHHRRHRPDPAARRGPRHGLTCPLITTLRRQEVRQVREGAVWLAADRTSPYPFYQYWINIDDRDVERFLLSSPCCP